MIDKKLIKLRISYSIVTLATILCTILLICYRDYYIYSNDKKFPVIIIYSILLFILQITLIILVIITNEHKNNIKRNKVERYKEIKITKPTINIKTKKHKNDTNKKKIVNIKEKTKKELKVKKSIKMNNIKIKNLNNLNNIYVETLKELKIKKIIYYIFLALTFILLLTEFILMVSIVLSIIAYPMLIPSISCSIITIILHNDIKQLKFQIYLNEIISNKDSEK